MGKYMEGFSPVHIARAEDLPYFDSPPIQYTYQSTAALQFGLYEWEDDPSPFNPDRPVMENALYFFRSFSFMADVDEGDYTSAVINIPEFRLFLRGDANAPLLREPLLMTRFFSQFDYRFWFRRGKVNEVLNAGFSGLLQQTPALVGKTNITLTAVISAQEVTDENFINLFTQHYPALKTGGPR